MVSDEWLAGFFDGEGTIQLASYPSRNGKLYTTLKVLLAQSGEEGKALLEEVVEQYGGRVYEHLKAGQHKATKSAYKWYICATNAAAFLRRIEPYLKLKKEKAQDAIRFVEERERARQRV